MPLPTILALSGSTRQTSVNKAILDFIRTTYATKYDITIYDKLSDLPYFHPDNKASNTLDETTELVPQP